MSPVKKTLDSGERQQPAWTIEFGWLLSQKSVFYMPKKKFKSDFLHKCIMSCKAIDIAVMAVSPVKRSPFYSQQLQYETILTEE